ncbi:tripartite tricarboxylate transporter TctB family protein [Paracoccus sp. JM45]|uniref:tripartite tricarboxylate transporter TctB family protein n=1 Tax=Paracoccus sp. JM45 TaxID=2283626 RepID=UPI000E6BF0CC|nr:tripartite tricarboxylate transporter TctB family protein [Paracoccus sp. JM45]RJE79664.1 hypothetical protein DWB67_11135 [Paracoccus sp. JM45]
MTTVPRSSGKNAIIGLLFLVVAASGGTMLRHSRFNWLGTPIPGDPGPFFLISICLSITGLTGTIMLGLAVRRNKASLRCPVFSMATTGLPAAYVIALIVMPIAMRSLGTTLATSIFAMIWITVLMYRQGTSIPRIAISASGFGIGAALFIQLVFVRLLTLPLP